MWRQKKFPNLKVIVLSLSIFLVGVTIGLSQSTKIPTLSSNIYDELKLFSDVLSHVQRDYVEETK
ncbi:MAG TPA: hypothetical protein VLK23_12385, partial [Thermodesulfobacteriota bacterium]|nr:hypothetical protein [Thermodesulfobacteriota bacterium]